MMRFNINLFRLSLPVVIYYLLNYLLVLFLKEKIGYSNYGQIGVLLSYSSLFQTFILFGYNNGVDLIILNGKNWENYLAKTTVISFVFSFFSLIILFFINRLNSFIVISLLHSVFFLYVGIFKSKLTSLGEYKKNASLQLINVSISSFMTFIFFLFFKDYEWRLIFLILADACVLFIFFKKDFYKLFINLKNLFNLNLALNEDLKFYMFIVLHGLFSFFYSNYDRIYIAEKSSFALSVQYWFYLQLTLPLLVLGEIFVRYKIKDLYSNVFLLYFRKRKKFFNIFIPTSLLLFSFLLHEIKVPILLIILGQIFNAFYLPLSSILFSRKNSNYILFFTIFIALLQLFVYYIFDLNTLLLFAKSFFVLSLIRTTIYFIYVIYFMKDEEPTNLSIV